MKSSGKICIAILVLSSIVAPGTAQDDLQAVANRAKRSIVTVITFDKTGKIVGQAKGFFVGDTGDVVTIRHIFGGAAGAQIKTLEGKSFAFKEVVDRDVEADLLRIKIDATPGEETPVAVLGTLPGVGQRVFIISASESSDAANAKVIEGTILKIEDAAPGKNVKVAAPIPPQSIGSPVFDVRGQVVGVVTSSKQGKDTFSFVGGSGTAMMMMTMTHKGPVLEGFAIKRVPPSYPVRAKSEHISGTVLVEVVVDESGNVVQASALSGHAYLQDAAVEAARHWKFSPNKLDGVPVKVVGTITFNFTL